MSADVSSAAMPGAFTVRVEARFEAAHNLRSYRGPAEPLHGHSYLVIAELEAAGGGLDSDAIAVDFVAATKELEKLAKRLDYGYINEVEPFTEINPSAENIAEWFAREMDLALVKERGRVKSIVLWEGPANSVTFTPER
jgi:6-pyruvoyltetrahydropterin/6-carboxytetrahydropterin synthase